MRFFNISFIFFMLTACGSNDELSIDGGEVSQEPPSFDGEIVLEIEIEGELNNNPDESMETELEADEVYEFAFIERVSSYSGEEPFLVLEGMTPRFAEAVPFEYFSIDRLEVVFNAQNIDDTVNILVKIYDYYGEPRNHTVWNITNGRNVLVIENILVSVREFDVEFTLLDEATNAFVEVEYQNFDMSRDGEYSLNSYLYDEVSHDIEELPANGSIIRF